MTDPFSAQAVTTEVLWHLERRRATLASDSEATATQVQVALAQIERSYVELELPRAYFTALAAEITSVVPKRWLKAAQVFATVEERNYGVWRSGDLLSRLAYVGGGLLLGAVVVAVPFIPIWWKGFPLLLAAAGYFLPDAQVRLQKRRYAAELGDIARDVGAAQLALDRHMADAVTTLAAHADLPKDSPP